MIKSIRSEIQMVNSTGDNQSGAAYLNGEMFSGLTTNLTQSVKFTGSMAGGYLKFGASAIA
mgnify:CR=1 FL=1